MNVTFSAVLIVTPWPIFGGGASPQPDEAKGKWRPPPHLTQHKRYSPLLSYHLSRLTGEEGKTCWSVGFDRCGSA